jgi:hypothetical protein
MNKAIVTKVVVGAAIVAGSLGISGAAYAAPTGGSSTAVVASAKKPAAVDCGLVRSLFGIYAQLGASLPVAVNAIVINLGGLVSDTVVRACLNLPELPVPTPPLPTLPTLPIPSLPIPGLPSLPGLPVK